MKTRLNGLLAFAAAAALAGTPAIAAPAANGAARLSVAGGQARAATPANKGSKAIPTTTLINIGILAALVGVVLVATDDNGGSDTPDSP